MKIVVRIAMINIKAKTNKIAGDAQTKPWHVSLKIFISKNLFAIHPNKANNAADSNNLYSLITKVILMLRLIIKSFMIFASLFFLFNTTSQAGSVEQGMKDFLLSNSNTNYSSGGAYKSQRRGYYATPSVYTRNPVVDVRPISMAMPTFRGGCGGIDMFAGSFSHINADQFIALMKAIPSNAMGYGFQLALETVSPSIADTMNKMESIMRDINNANLN